MSGAHSQPITLPYTVPLGAAALHDLLPAGEAPVIPAAVLPAAAAPAAQAAAPRSASTTRTGHWSAKEHALFEVGVRAHDRKWDRVAAVVGTRSSAQVRSHAQKHSKKPVVVKPPFEVRRLDGHGGPAAAAWRCFDSRADAVKGCPGLSKQTLAVLLGQGSKFEARRVDNAAGEAAPVEIRAGRNDAWRRFNSMDEASKAHEGLSVHHISALVNAKWAARVLDHGTYRACVDADAPPAHRAEHLGVLEVVDPAAAAPSPFLAVAGSAAAAAVDGDGEREDVVFPRGTEEVTPPSPPPKRARIGAAAEEAGA